VSASEGLSRSTVAGAIRGDADAIRAVWQDNRRWVAAVLLAHKPREVDLEDLLQEVAMSFVKTVGKLRDEAMLKPWLRTVAINAARASGRDARRRRRGVVWKIGSERAAEAHLEASHGADLLDPVEPSGPPERSEQAGRLLGLAARLPEGYREPLILKTLRGMSYRQIGEMLGLPETTVETRIARGRKMLRELAAADSLAETDSAKGGTS
jgi:RNA polymerase sigma-70 factor (ECF subfamily)